MLVDCADGRELGAERRRLRTRRDRRAPAGAGRRRRARARLGAAGSRGLPASAGATCPRLLAETGVDPDEVIGVGIDFTSCTMLPTLADGTPLCVLDELRREPHAWVKLWKHHAAQPEADRINAVGDRARRAMAGPLRREDLVGVVLREGAADPRRGARGLRARRSADRGARLGRLAADRRGEPERAAPRATRRCGRSATGFRPTRTSPRSTRASSTSSTRSCRARIAPLGARAGGAQRAGRRAGPGSCRHGGGRRERRLPRLGPGRARDRPGNAGDDHGHEQLPHPARRRARRGRGHVRRRRGRRRARAVRLRGRPVGASATSSAGSRDDAVPPSTTTRRAGRAATTCTTCSRSRRARCGRARPACSRSTGGTATARCSSTPTCSGLLVGMTLATRRAEIYRALIEATAFGTRVIIEAFEQAGLRVDAIVACGGLPERNPLLMQIFADVIGREIAVAASRRRPRSAPRCSAPSRRAPRRRHATIAEASSRMARLSETVFRPAARAPRRLRRPLRRIPAPARPLRSRRRRRHAPAEAPPERRCRRGSDALVSALRPAAVSATG